MPKPAQTKSVPTTVTFLEMLKRPARIAPNPPFGLGQLALMRTLKMPAAYYRYLFAQVGEDYKWFSRHVMDDDELVSIIHNDNVEIFVLYRDGSPSGYFEIDFRTPENVEICFIGLTRDHVGQGLGGYLLDVAIERAWERNPERVHLQTCTLDHPSALKVYQKKGFTPCGQTEVMLEIPVEFFN